MTEMSAKMSAVFANHFGENNRVPLKSHILTSEMAAAAKKNIETHNTVTQN